MELDELNRQRDYDAIPRAELQEIFDRIDRNGDGNVVPVELAEAIKNEMPGWRNCQRIVDSIFEHGDVNNDGKINFEEFCRLYTHVATQTFFQRFFHLPTVPTITRKAKSYWGNVKLCPPPIIIILIVICQWIIHIVGVNNFEFDPSKKNQVWRYVTYSLVHVDYPHLIANSIFQLVAGVILEVVHGWRVPVIYVSGVVAGSLSSAVFEFTASLKGASAGAYALIMSWFSDFMLNFSEQTCPMLSLIPVILFLIWDVFNSQRTSDVSLVAHAAGGVIGFLVALVILVNIRVHRFETVLRFIASILLVAFFATFIALNATNIHR